MADFKRDIQAYGGINPQTGCILLRGNIRMLGEGSEMAQLVIGDLGVGGNTLLASAFVAGNITSEGNFIGNGALMSGVTSTLPSRANIDIIGNVAASGNVSAEYFIGDGTYLTGITSSLPEAANIDVYGNVTAPGNVSAEYFLGNGSLLTGLLSSFPGTANIDIVGNVDGTYAIVSGNVSADYLFGNGSLLTGILNTLPTAANIDIAGNVIGAFVDTDNLTVSGDTTIAGKLGVTGNVGANYFNGNGYYMTLRGLTLIPQGNVANASVRLALNVPAGALITQEDNNTQYLLTTTPPSASANWLNFTGANFPVTTVFGRSGEVSAFPNDYNDSQIQLSANVGTATTTVHVSDALAYLNTYKANIVNGNVSATYFLGNGSQLTGLLTVLPAVANIDIRGNLIGTYANIANVIAIQGNVGNTRFLGGNVAISGQVNSLGNIVAPFFIGNGSQLTGLTSVLASYRRMRQTTPQSYNFNSLSGGVTAVLYTTTESSYGTDITYGAFPGMFTLAPGKTYRLRGSINYFTGNTDATTCTYRWYVNSNATLVGSSVRCSLGNSASNVSSAGGTAEAIITPSTSTFVSLVFQATANVVLGISGTSAGTSLYPWADIEVIAGQSPITLTGNATVDIVGNVFATGNVDASNVSTSVLMVNGNAFVSGNITSGPINVSGNIVLSSGKSVFSSQTPFKWNSYYHGNPTISGNNIATAVTGGPGGTYINSASGYRLALSGTGNQNNSLNWNLTNIFDFSKDFELSVDMYLSGGGGSSTIGDGLIFAMGGSSSSGSAIAGNILNGSLVTWYNSYVGQLEMYSNGSVLTPAVVFQSGSYYAEFMAEKVRVETVGNRRFMDFIHNNGHVLNSADVTSWSPSGAWLGITGKTGGATSTAYITGVTLRYI